MTGQATRCLLDHATCVQATQALAQGQPLAHVARALGVTLGTLRQALRQVAWQAWCAQCQAEGAPQPETPGNFT